MMSRRCMHRLLWTLGEDASDYSRPSTPALCSPCTIACWKTVNARCATCTTAPMPAASCGQATLRLRTGWKCVGPRRGVTAGCMAGGPRRQCFVQLPSWVPGPVLLVKTDLGYVCLEQQ